MEHSSPDMTVEQICTVIDLLNPCIDDHLYVYDFTNDYYYISPHAAERFPIPGTAFHNVIENHRHFVYAPDLADGSAEDKAVSYALALGRPVMLIHPETLKTKWLNVPTEKAPG